MKMGKKDVIRNTVKCDDVLPCSFLRYFSEYPLKYAVSNVPNALMPKKMLTFLVADVA
jgi:hypothetical protein